MSDLDEFLSLLDDSPFEETPVDVQTFVESPDYLGLPYLSDIQYDIVEAMSQIYYLDDVKRYMGRGAGEKHFNKYTKTEIILKLGKGCHAPDTSVFDPLTGTYQKLSEQAEGRVVSSDGKSHYATESFVEGRGSMVRVTTSLGFKEDVYVGHKYLGYTRQKFYKRNERWHQPKYLKVSDIAVGDRIAVTVGFDVDSPIDIPVEHAELIGYWLGDGMMPRDGLEHLNVDFNVNEVESIQRYKELCAAIGDEPNIVNHKNKKMVSFRHYKKSNALRLVRDYGMWGMRSKTKYIPPAVLASSNKVLARTIAKLWQTDGCIYSKNGTTAEFVSVSERLATDVHRALIRLGVPAGIRNRVPKSNFNASMAWYVTVSSQESFNKFADVIHLLDHKMVNRLDKAGRIYKRLEGNLYYDRVVNIEPIGIGEYWTRTVPDTDNYVGTGLVSANSGKDHLSTIACAYVVYKLLCLKDPAAYYGKPPGDAIDILNVAINAQQAKNVFFKGFRSKIERSPWFKGKFSSKIDSIDFDKSVSVYSGHSERESHEGLNLILAILDEISGFAMDNPSGLEKAKTGDAIYKAFRGTVDSRFDMGKVVLLSFPRFDGCFISQRYDEVVAEKEQFQREHLFIINPDRPHDDPDNQWLLRWKEDRIISYRFPGFFALCRPTWEVNPTKKIDDFKIAFLTDEMDARTRFLAQPSQISDALFGRVDKLKSTITHLNPLGDLMAPMPHFVPKKGVKYFMHADLAQKVDRCAVGIAHVDKWVGIEYSSGNRTVQPFVICDAIGYWKPGVGKPVDLEEVKKWIIGIRSQGFDIELITFDRWGSVDMQRDLNALGLKSETLSVNKKHYDDLMVIMYEDRLKAPQCYNPDGKKEILFDELKNLRVVKGRVEHPRSSSGKDLSDALCGAVFNAATRSRYSADVVVEVHDITTHFEDYSWIKDRPIEISDYDEESEIEEMEYRLM